MVAMHQPVLVTDDLPLYVIWDYDYDVGEELYWTGADGSLSEGFTPCCDEAALLTYAQARALIAVARKSRPYAEIGNIP